MVIVVTLLGALALASSARAGVSKYCTLLSAHEVADPLGLETVRTSSVSVPYPSQTGAKGKITLCSHKTPNDLVAETSVAKFSNPAGAMREFSTLVHREQKAGEVTKTSGPWNAAYYLGRDGFVALRGRYMFHVQYASGAPGYSRITSKTLASLAGRAVRKL